jgi:hypothetical protein
MKTRTTAALLRMTAAAALLATAGNAHAILLDHGPGDPTLVFPQWYRDLTGQALGLCLSQTPSPNAAAGLKPFCFPFPPSDPAGFAGNLGPEIFYNNINAKLKGPAFSMSYIGGLEASYLPAGVPIHGTEAVFARIRVIMNVPVAGTYKVTHPFGVEVFPDVQPGARGVFFTNDVGLTIGNFDLAMTGPVGPWAQWDQLLPGETLTVTNAAGATESFVGDGNYAHTFTGSPFGTNYIRVDGPVGSNLDGAGNDFILTPLANVMGQKWLAAIPTPLQITRSTYTRDPAANKIDIDVWAKALPTAKLVLSGTDVPSVIMKSDGLGNFMAHLEKPATAALPAFVNVTNMSDNPVTTATATLADVVTVTKATYDTLTKTLSVAATSSDLLAPSPVLTVAGFVGSNAAGAGFSALVASGIPPASVTVQSSAAGKETELVAILPGLADNPASPPVAVPDTLTASENTATPLAVLANDSVPAGAAAILIVRPPASGTAVATAVAPLVVNYTPNANFVGADSFDYIVQDALGQLSNVTTASITVAFAAFPPTANGDNWAQVRGTAKTVSLIANDVAATGTTINPASIVITSAPVLQGTTTAAGSVVVNVDGTVTFTPSQAGSIVFSYTVKNNFGQASAPAQVFVFSSASAEVVSFTKATYTTAKKTWVIVGSTNWFGPGLTPSVTCWVGNSLATKGAQIGTALIDVTGKFSIQVAGSLTPPDATKAAVCATSSGGVGVVGVTVQEARSRHHVERPRLPKGSRGRLVAAPLGADRRRVSHGLPAWCPARRTARLGSR